MTTALENRLEKRLGEWRKLAKRYRCAQNECDEQSDEWHLNKENAEMIDRLAAEIREDLSAARAISRSMFGP